jgi:hypothetical protein
VLLLALVGFNLFAVQTWLVPQVRDYHPSWHGARWIVVPGSSGAVAYFRKTITLEAPPTAAFLTVQAEQVYSLYVNGRRLADTQHEFESGATNLAHIYDVTPFLQAGVCTIALRVVQSDEGAPALRAVLGVSLGSGLEVFPSDSTWRVTADPQLAQPFDPLGGLDWGSAVFRDDAWEGAGYLSGPQPPNGALHVDPVVFEAPLSADWVSLAPAPDAFFYRSLTLPPAKSLWLRIAATGAAQVFINGHLIIQQTTALGPVAATQPSMPTLPAGTQIAGVYDVTPYLHAGANDLAIHVAFPGVGGPDGLTEAPAAFSLDLLLATSNGTNQRLDLDQGWRGTAIAAVGWTNGGGQGWLPTTPSGPVIALGAAGSTTPQATLVAPGAEGPDVAQSAVIAMVTALLLLAGAIGVGIQCGRRWTATRCAAALDRLGLALAPVVAFMGLLEILSLEPLMPRPFPYTPLWMGLLVGFAVASCALVVAVSRRDVSAWSGVQAARRAIRERVPVVSLRIRPSTVAVALGVIGLEVVGLYLVTYQLPYESYWPDEVTSVYAALGVLHTGMPVMISGFLYEKAELFSYMLAALVAVFGDGPIATRSLSVAEYLVSLPFTYFVGRYFLGRRAGLLAMALMVFSPMALRWGREARMYQQVELCALLMLYLFYRAVQPGARTRYIYLSMLAAVAMYLSHEESFIMLPAIVICFLATQRLSWVRNRHWWIAGFSAIGVIGLQLLLVQVTHPSILGTDSTERPLIGFSPQNLEYYFRLLFVSRSLSNGSLANLSVTSLLATASGIAALFTRDRALRYLSLFLFMPLVFLSLTFTLVADRYIYVMLPVFALLAAAALVRLVDVIRRLAERRTGPVSGRAIAWAFGALLVLSVLSGQMTGISNFSLAASRSLGIAFHHRYPDYLAAGAYIHAHWQPGDVLITIAPAIDGAFYAERPSYLLYENRALYLFERDGHILDTPTGSTVLLNGNDLAAVLANHHRVWLFSEPLYQCCGRVAAFPLAQNFRLVFEGWDTLVYLRSG